MKKFPTEIVDEITSYLSIVDKLNLACVFKQLYKTVSENSSYNKLVFDNKLKFDQAMDLYNKRNFDQQVRDVCIVNMDYDLQLVLAIPTIFPQVRYQELKSGRDELGSQFVGVNAHVFKAMAKNWRNVEHIVDSSSNIMNVTMRLLDFLTFDHLASLELSLTWKDRPTTHQRHERTQALMEVIHNAPSLEELVIRHLILKITDIKNLHVGATKLKHLEFRDVDMYTKDLVEDQIQYFPCEILESFSITNPSTSPQLVTQEGTAAENQTFANTIKNWVSYIGVKYTQLKNLYFSLSLLQEDHFTAEDKELITTSLTTALTTMKQLKRYSVDLCTNLQPVLDVMKTNSVYLKYFGFAVDGNDSVEEMSTVLQTAQSTASISSLGINCTDKTDILALSSTLINICHSLKYLTSLAVYSFSDDDVPILLTDILQNLNALTSLEFGDLVIREEGIDDVFYNKVSGNHVTEGLESVCIHFDIEDGDGSMKKSNLPFAFILRSCPKLKQIKLSAGEVLARGSISLDFRGNSSLKNITIQMPNCRYYTFHHEFGKHWKNAKEEISNQYSFKRKQEKDLPYFVNLAWGTTKDIGVELTGCGSE